MPGGPTFDGAAAILDAVATTDDRDAVTRSGEVTAGAGDVCFVLAVVTWGLMAADVSRAAAPDTSCPDHVANGNWIPSLGFVASAFPLQTNIRVSGWIASRRLGRVTNGGPVLGGIAPLAIFGWVAEVD